MADRKLTEILKRMADDHHDLTQAIGGLADSPAKTELTNAAEEMRRALVVADSHRNQEDLDAKAAEQAKKQADASAKGAAQPPRPTGAEQGPSSNQPTPSTDTTSDAEAAAKESGPSATPEAEARKFDRDVDGGGRENIR